MFGNRCTTLGTGYTPPSNFYKWVPQIEFMCASRRDQIRGKRLILKNFSRMRARLSKVFT